ncbi:uncharacterized protein AMSG_12109 [Thecamonas trahens ATCC 50062]|uniref:Phospholipid/glycerol acyltransferase domain-containing protein n=1 Tax=Thecamonas trahens ATCC 50062 TaxID=461836 RepID=A0A0L0DKA3_THETB|nr:hypothetical protein AMSG_12109 [Thecamonas trahens ATCC 50062]KNC51798.1 hypothetical protein AMSG_12109 [Thecamonas trahens ATCC 50062]|eukprot:XP_013755767.1 hypothetical protein AMSG_12109 [Thecamonas trahens ATCC 50062]
MIEAAWAFLVAVASAAWTAVTWAGWIVAGAAVLAVASMVGGAALTWIIRKTKGFGLVAEAPVSELANVGKTAPMETARGEGDESISFLPDEVISQSWIFKLAKALNLPFARWFWGLSVEGLSKVSRDKPYLFVGLHTSHNHDILACIFIVQDETGRTARSLIHRKLATSQPWIRFVGSVPGYRATAVNLLRAGYWVAVIPGGADEAMAGYDAAYTVQWPESRKGFARVAAAAGADIVPVVTSNSEEMKFVPLFWLWSKLGGGVLYHKLLAIPALKHPVRTVGVIAWFISAWISIPLPVKATIHVGEPIVHDPDRSVDDTVAVTKDQLRALIATHQPGGLSYLAALKARWFGGSKPKADRGALRPLEEVVASLKTNIEHGLSSSQVARRAAEAGASSVTGSTVDGQISGGGACCQWKNRIVASVFNSMPTVPGLIRQLPLASILVLLATIAWLLLADGGAESAIALAVLLALHILLKLGRIGYGLVQARGVDELQVTVVDGHAMTFATRNSKRCAVEVKDLVPGDIIALEQGTFIRAAVRLAGASREFKVDTGSTIICPDLGTSVSNVLLPGTAVLAGGGTGVVLAHGGKVPAQLRMLLDEGSYAASSNDGAPQSRLPPGTHRPVKSWFALCVLICFVGVVVAAIRAADEASAGSSRVAELVAITVAIALAIIASTSFTILCDIGYARTVLTFLNRKNMVACRHLERDTLGSLASMTTLVMSHRHLGEEGTDVTAFAVDLEFERAVRDELTRPRPSAHDLLTRLAAADDTASYYSTELLDGCSTNSSSRAYSEELAAAASAEENVLFRLLASLAGSHMSDMDVEPVSLSWMRSVEQRTAFDAGAVAAAAHLQATDASFSGSYLAAFPDFAVGPSAEVSALFGKPNRGTYLVLLGAPDAVIRHTSAARQSAGTAARAAEASGRKVWAIAVAAVPSSVAKDGSIASSELSHTRFALVGFVALDGWHVVPHARSSICDSIRDIREAGVDIAVFGWDVPERQLRSGANEVGLAKRNLAHGNTRAGRELILGLESRGETVGCLVFDGDDGRAFDRGQLLMSNNPENSTHIDSVSLTQPVLATVAPAIVRARLFYVFLDVVLQHWLALLPFVLAPLVFFGASGSLLLLPTPAYVAGLLVSGNLIALSTWLASTDLESVTNVSRELMGFGRTGWARKVAAFAVGCILAVITTYWAATEAKVAGCTDCLTRFDSEAVCHSSLVTVTASVAAMCGLTLGTTLGGTTLLSARPLPVRELAAPIASMAVVAICSAIGSPLGFCVPNHKRGSAVARIVVFSLAMFLVTGILAVVNVALLRRGLGLGSSAAAK